jgi:Ca2+-transporting ATPase
VENLDALGKDFEKDLTFCGLIGMIDPPRPQAKKAVEDCKNAGIKPVMITGDHIITAKAIAKELGIFEEKDQAISGKDLEKLSQLELEKNIYNYSVFARVSPEHKVRIVRAFQKRGAVVAMTGDGVNDAPALKAADIGCAMGISGTDVAKGAADMIMTDDNFATIVEAVRQGRGIYENIRRTIYFLISSNIGEIVAVLTAFLVQLPAPLLEIHLLWVNLVTDSLPAMALGAQPISKDIMKRKPIGKNKSIFADGSSYSIALEGTFIGAVSFLAFVVGYRFFDNSSTPWFGRTMAFVVLSFAQVLHVLNVRTDRSIFRAGLFGDRKMIYSIIACILLQVFVVLFGPIDAIFKTVPLSSHAWVICIGLALSVILLVEMEKFLKNKHER